MYKNKKGAACIDIPYLADMEYLVTMTDYSQPLAEGGFYHLYNRGNNGENIFFQQRNYNYFLNKLNDYIGSYLNFLCILSFAESLPFFNSGQTIKRNFTGTFTPLIGQQNLK